jgi:uncharacterized protein (DUF305 family)
MSTAASGTEPTSAIPADPDQVSGAPEPDDDFITLPWWQNPLNIIAMLIAVLVLAAGAGFVIGERNAQSDPNAVDVGFLQDMRTHHEQAVEMGLIFIAKTGTDPVLAEIAKEIAFDQGVDIGRMIQLLRDDGKPEANLTDTAMTWMNEPTPAERMPGLATEADLVSLVRATGAEADRIFVTLMIAHHQGGIHMAEYAVAHANTGEVRAFAKGMISGQRDEIVEMQKILASMS